MLRFVGGSLKSYTVGQDLTLRIVADFILFRNKGPKSVLQVATKYNMTLAQHLCVYSIYVHTCIL